MNGEPCTEYVANEFKKRGLDVRLTIVNNKRVFAKRGWLRNIQCDNFLNSDCDYIFFADADNVYSPDFFKVLNIKLKANGEIIHNCIFSSIKVHALLKETEEMISSARQEIPFIENAFNRSFSLPQLYIPKLDRRDGGAAGCMQVVARKDLLDIGKGYYVRKSRKFDHDLFVQGQLARSDIEFRNRMHGSTKIRLPVYVHLQHMRDKELGYHTEVQR